MVAEKLPVPKVSLPPRQRKQQILDQLDQQLQKNKDAWVDTILTRVLGGGQ